MFSAESEIFSSTAGVNRAQPEGPQRVYEQLAVVLNGRERSERQLILADAPSAAKRQIRERGEGTDRLCWKMGFEQEEAECAEVGLVGSTGMGFEMEGAGGSPGGMLSLSPLMSLMPPV